MRVPLLLTVAVMSLAVSSFGQEKQKPLPKELAPYFRPPAKYADDLGSFRSVLTFNDGTPVKTAADWQKRRQELLSFWHKHLGTWPPILDNPKVEYLGKEKVEGYTEHHVRIEVAPGKKTDDAYLLMPEGPGPFPGVVVVFYEAKTGIGKGKNQLLDFARALAKRGIVALSIGSDPNSYYPDKANAQVQPLSYHAYVAANGYHILASLPQVDAARIGVVGHSYGGKWAMFAACLYDRFACGATSDPGIVFDESNSNVNYWEPWYIGYEPGKNRKRGIPNDERPRMGPYKKLLETGDDLHELHVLMAPRPFFVSGGSEDPPHRWQALNHLVAVNRLLGYENRVGMTNREKHTPTPESNEVMYRFFEHFLNVR